MTMQVGIRSIDTSNEKKVFFPSDGITKGDLIDYYERIAPTMLRYLHDRPLMMHRFPDGIEGEDFYHKDVPDYFPDWIPRVTVAKEGGTLDQLICNEAACLVYIADQGTITPHVWLSRVDELRKPDRLIFDLDPPDEAGDEGFELVREGARALTRIYEDLEITPFAMTTGSRGLHIVIALDRSTDFDEARAFARRIAKAIERRNPDRFTTEPRKIARKGRLYLDIARNAYAQTAVAPYAIRAKPRAPVATPLRIEEIEDSNLGPQSYRMDNIFRRLGQLEDPWRDIDRHAVNIDAVQRRLARIVSA
jgi:bifunctional non-homologous end joining protein LigD